MPAALLLFLSYATTVSFSPSVLGLPKKISNMLSSTDIATANYNISDSK